MVSVLELLVHNKNDNYCKNPYLISIAVPENITIVSTDPKKLSSGWHRRTEYTRWIGDQFLHENSSLVLQVPSSIISMKIIFLSTLTIKILRK